ASFCSGYGSHHRDLFCSVSRFGLLSPPSHLLFFCFSSSLHHRDLHSFPTRRSSDLHPGPDGIFASGGVTAAGQNFFPANIVNDRSEEHTSELQSRVDLVCRLLLEKKKDTTKNRGSTRTATAVRELSERTDGAKQACT